MVDRTMWYKVEGIGFRVEGSEPSASPTLYLEPFTLNHLLPATKGR